MRRNRHLVVLVAVLLLVGTCRTSSADDWPRAAPADAGLAPDMGDRIDAGVRAGRFQNLHGVVVVRGGKLVLERYYAGPDERWGAPRGHVSFDADTLHDLRSVSKSIVGLLYGIARAEGKAPPLDAPLVDQFPEYPELADAPTRRRMTVAHALSMMLGTEWNERLPYTDPRNSEIAMERSDDRYRFVLDRPMATEPGTEWVYNGGATAIVGRLVAKGSGRTLAAYADAKLFGPLGITDVEWVRGRDGEHAAASGLRLRPRDLARIGQLVLNGGRWGDAQVVPADWLDLSFRTRARLKNINYGYHWWLGPAGPDGPRWIAGFGNGGQRLWINPGLDMVVVVTAGNYNQRDAWKLPVAIITEIVLPGPRPRR